MSESVYAVHVALLFSAKMTERLEQWYCIKFCQKLGDSQVETIRKIQQVFSNNAMGITQIKEWYNQFKNGRLSVESDARLVGPQQAEITSSLTKCGLLSCRTVVSLSENLGGR